MSENSETIIRPMTEEDVPVLVRLHSEVFADYDNTMMGVDYLRGLYHMLACHTACISIVAVEGGEIAGWIGGVWDWPVFQRVLTRRSILGAPRILVSILKNRPRLLQKAFSFVWPVVSQCARPCFHRGVCQEKDSASPQVALLVIGVDSRRQKRGVGQSMMKSFDHLLLSRGFAAISASTFKDNEAGNKAFRKAGYVLYKTDAGVCYYSKHLIQEMGD